MVSVWFTEISQPKGHRSLQTYVKDVTPTGVRINIETWDGRQFDGARVAYLAYPANSDAIKGGGTFFGPKEDWRLTNWPGDPFKSEPWVFTAINMIDVGENEKTMDIMVSHQHSTAEQIRHCGWASEWTDLKKIGQCWIGILC